MTVETEEPTDGGPPGDPQLEVTQLTRGQIAQAAQETALPPPTASPAHLPLAQLDPGVFEQLVTEIVTRQDNSGAHFYGRSGQKQWGLDIVEHHHERRNHLYQVRRLQEITPTGIRSAVEDYAGPPRPNPNDEPARRFDPSAFTLVTTAPFDDETANVDELDALRGKYCGDLDLAVWGAEHVERTLRSEPYIVAAYLGHDWAKAWCGADVTLPAPTAPAALGFVESPYEVLGLITLRSEAADLESTDPLRSAGLYRALAGELDSSGFPGHAATVRRSQAGALRAAGDAAAALEVLTGLAITELTTRTAGSHSRARAELTSVAADLGPTAIARSDAIEAIAHWHLEVCDLAALVPALITIADAADPWSAHLVCLAIEQAVVDGWFDSEPAESPFTRVLENPDELIHGLRELARSLDCADPTIRARLRTAVADADLTWNSSTDEVEAAFRDVINDANAGRFLSARSLVISRAAFAFATRGGFDRADGLWRQAAIYSSEDGYYGDVRHALRASQRVALDHNVVSNSQMEVIQALPNRKKMLAGAYDPALIAYEQAHNGKVRQAFGDGRRYLWESRTSGHWADWLLAVKLVGDVLTAVDHVPNAVHLLVAAGLSQEAEDAARKAGGFINVLRWLGSPMPRVRAAATTAIHAQLPLLPEDLDETVQSTLSALAPTIWTHDWNPHPGHLAVKALTAFRGRLRSHIVDPIIELAAPARSQPTLASEALASLLMQLYGAVPERRADIADVLRDLLALEQPPHNLWEIIESVPEDMRSELLVLVEEIAAVGRPPALMTLAAWGVPNDTAQVMARLACASLLRNPVGVHRETLHLTTQAATTVDLLTYLAQLDDHYEVPPARLAPAHRYVAGGVLMQVQYGTSAPPPPTASAPAEAPPTPPPPPVLTAEEQEALKQPDEIARIAAGGVDGLVHAVALHLAAVGEDITDYGPQRVNALSALFGLVGLLDAPTAAEIGQRMFELHRDPKLGDIDKFAESANNLLSSGRLNLRADRIAPYALMIAATCYQRVHSINSAPLDSSAVVEHAVAAATALLASPAEDLQVAGGNTIAALSNISPAAELVFALVSHPNPTVRSLGAHAIVATPPLLGVLARDRAPQVRVAVATRATLLDEDTVAQLAADPHAAVRAAIATADPDGSEAPGYAP